ncbi:MAG: response regulator transcription factor [Anaerolineae bacterium]|nr:response regulator transcription factor [Anaerolineae bacterium]
MFKRLLAVPVVAKPVYSKSIKTQLGEQTAVDKPQILIVEDDLDLSEMLSAYFRVQNYDVLTAAWGKEALDIAKDNHTDLIVLDIRLPDIDGYEVCRQLRTQRQTQDTPIIFLTEKRDRVDKLQGLELGVVDYITKPFDIQELRLRVRNAISRVNRQALVNPVTDLPEGQMVEERLTNLLTSTEKWTILQMSINSLGRFREMYGFVAADDVLRAVTLMIRNAVREHGGAEDYIGHIGAEDFIIITQTGNVNEIRDRIQKRIEQSREYFYPLKDREKAREAMEANHLRLNSGSVTNTDGPFEDVDALKKKLNAAVVANTPKS